MDEFTRQYIETALWSTNDESTPAGGVPMDANYDADDIHPDTLARMKADCAAFQAAHADDIACDPSQAGHDFWLTRNGHGAGFWDGDWPEEVGGRLTTASKEAGTYNLLVGDDGMIHGYPG